MHWKVYYIKDYITLTICGLQYKRSIDFNNHRLTNRHLAASREDHCEQCERIINLPNKKTIRNLMNKRMYVLWSM